jgi:hypothetical protein
VHAVLKLNFIRIGKRGRRSSAASQVAAKPIGREGNKYEVKT